MSVVFFVDCKQNSPSLRLPGPVACHILMALGYDLEAVAQAARLMPDDVLPRIGAVRRQFALGGSCEFTSEEVDEHRLLEHLRELEKVALRALNSGRNIVLL